MREEKYFLMAAQLEYLSASPYTNTAIRFATYIHQEPGIYYGDRN